MLLGLLAVAAGLAVGLMTAGYLWLADALVEGVWIDLPDALDIDSRWYTLAVCTAGGVAIGLGQRFGGDHPGLLDELLSDAEGSPTLQIGLLPRSLYMLLVSIAAGAALGPELGLVVVAGTIGLELARRIRDAEARAVARDVAIAGVFSAAFLSPLGGAATASEEPGATTFPRAGRVALAVVAGIAAVVGIALVPTSGLLVDADWPAYSPPRDGTDALLAVPLGLVGMLLALAYGRAEHTLRAMRPRLGVVGLPAVVAGVVLGLAGAWSDLMLFSGQEGIGELAETISSRSAGELAALGVGKLLLVALLLGAGWKGGHFYPMLFVAAAFGLCVSAFAGAVEPVVGVAAVSAGALTAVLGRVVAGALLVLLVVPASSLGVAAVAAVVVHLALRMAKRTAS